MEEASTIARDLAQRVFHVHRAGFDGSMRFREKLSRPQAIALIEATKQGIFAMNACAIAYFDTVSPPLRRLDARLHEGLLMRRRWNCIGRNTVKRANQ